MFGTGTPRFARPTVPDDRVRTSARGAPPATVHVRCVVGAPQWLGILALCTVASAAAWTGLLATETGRIALVDQWERTAVAIGQPVDDARYADLQRLEPLRSGLRRWPGAGGWTGLALVGGLALWLVGPAARTRHTPATFRQCLALSSHAGVILAVRDLVAAPRHLRGRRRPAPRPSASGSPGWTKPRRPRASWAAWTCSCSGGRRCWASALAALCGVSARRAVAGHVESRWRPSAAVVGTGRWTDWEETDNRGDVSDEEILTGV